MTSAGTQNLYSYVGNNPVNFVDPTGHNAIALLLESVVVAAAIIYIAAEAMLGETQTTTLTNLPPVVEEYIERVETKIRTKIAVTYLILQLPATIREARRLKEEEKEEEEEEKSKAPSPPFEPWPESEDDIPEDYEWKGSNPDPSSGKGNWHNPDTGESLHNDLNHPPGQDPHWDYTPGKGAPTYRWFRDGRMLPK